MKLEIDLRILVLASALAVGLTSAQANPNLVQNPGFELGGSDWTFLGDSGLQPGFAFAHSGNFSAFVNISSGSVNQAIATTPGDVYLIDFWLAGNLQPSTATVSFGSTTGFSQTYPLGAFAYQEHSFTAVATGTSTTLEFSGLLANGTFFWDDFSVTDTGSASVPDGGLTIAMLGASITGLSLLRRKFQS